MDTLFSGIRQVYVEQDFMANMFLSNLQGLLEKQTEPYVEAVSRKRKNCYKVNKNISWGSLKHRVVELFLYQDSLSVFKELKKLFGNYLERQTGSQISQNTKASSKCQILHSNQLQKSLVNLNLMTLL